MKKRVTHSQRFNFAENLNQIRDAEIPGIGAALRAPWKNMLTVPLTRIVMSCEFRHSHHGRSPDFLQNQEAKAIVIRLAKT